MNTPRDDQTRDDLLGRPMRIAVIGLGHQSVDDHIPAIQQSPLFELVGVADADTIRGTTIGDSLGVPLAQCVEDLLDTVPDIEVALVAIPHSSYRDVIQKLARNGISIIKEKPFAATSEDAIAIGRCVIESNVSLYVTLQRRFNPVFVAFKQLLRRIGHLYAIEARYTLNIERLDEGWRASRLYAGGGAIIDLGYHYVDLLTWYFGLPASVTCSLSTGNRLGQEYDVEDTAMLHMTYPRGDSQDTVANLIVSRVYPTKDEGLTAYGTLGSVSVRRGTLERRDTAGNSIEYLERRGTWPSALVDQLEAFAVGVRDRRDSGRINRNYLEHAALVSAAYKSAEEARPVSPQSVFQAMVTELDGAVR